jgi:uncharacterized protein (DUF697 family)
MNRKKLPKAIEQTAADMRALGANERLDASAFPTYATEPGADNVVEMTPKQAAAWARGAQSAAGPAAAPTKLERIRRARAHKIVQRHAALAAAGGLVPLPFLNMASVTAVIVRMVKVLSAHYGAPFERDRANAIVVGLLGGAMPTGMAAVTISTLGYVLPSANLFGIAVSSITAAACTRGIGRFFAEHFESGATLADLPVPAQNP